MDAQQSPVTGEYHISIWCCLLSERADVPGQTKTGFHTVYQFNISQNFNGGWWFPWVDHKGRQVGEALCLGLSCRHVWDRPRNYWVVVSGEGLPVTSQAPVSALGIDCAGIVAMQTHKTATMGASVPMMEAACSSQPKCVAVPRRKI